MADADNSDPHINISEDNATPTQGTIPNAGGQQNNLPPLENIIPGVTPPKAQPNIDQQEEERKRRLKKRHNEMLIGIAAVIIVILVAGALVATASHKAPATSTMSTTTINVTKLTSITNCTVIDKPGTYYITKPISTSIKKGACITINASDVTLIGNLNMIKGSGPYVGIPPFTYAIYAKNVHNVSLQGLNLSSFSYGVYFYGVSNSTLMTSYIAKQTMSDILMNDSRMNKITNTTLGGVASKQGNIYIYSGGSNLFSNDLINNSAYYGAVINSTGNKFYKDNFTDNTVDLICNLTAGLRNANNFSSSTCHSSEYCAFAQCSNVNIPPAISNVILGKTITECGNINTSGTYTLSSELNLMNYINVSNPLSKGDACITVTSPNVHLNCKGNAIDNAMYGIYENGVYNITVSNCMLNNDTYGIYINNTQVPYVYNSTIANSVYGLYLHGANTGSISNVSVSNSTYGIYTNASTAITYYRFNLKGNDYGIYFAGGSGSTFSSGYTENNKRSDLYCTASTYNSTSNLFENTGCGVTDCNWGAGCTSKALPPISVYPLSGCYNITYPGSYALTKNLINYTSRCIDIKADNVSFSCNGHSIGGAYGSSAIYANGVNNVSISNCGIEKFAAGIVVSNSSDAKIQYNNITNVYTGVVLVNDMNPQVTGQNVTTFSSSGIFMNRVSNGIITSNIELDGSANATGMLVLNSSNNLIAYNNATRNGKYGILFSNSIGNNVFNNSAYGNAVDYYCSPGTGGIYAQRGGVNFGNTKHDCIWLVELNPLTIAPKCYAISSGASILMTSDMLYPYGTTCFNIYNTKNTSGNNTIINCNYHTMLASNGGAFVSITNSSNVKVINCYIKNFTTAITDSAGYPTFMNDTIVSVNNSISIENANYSTILNDTIMNASHGIMISKSNYGKVEKNKMINTSIALEVSGGQGFEIQNNTANRGVIGAYIINSTLDSFANNKFLNMSEYGIDCTLFAQNASSLNKDLGGNACSSNNACYWMTASPNCKA
ncbi:MAG: NosD domain-containing protein [Candidatus Micrarchaeia archaeon]